jgi:hypothetical protein
VQAVGSVKPVDVGTSVVAPYEKMARLLLLALEVHCGALFARNQ